MWPCSNAGKRSTADLRVFSAAFQSYAQEKGDWPPGDAVPGAFPPGMAGHLGKTNWERVTPVGGLYTWAPNSLHQGEPGARCGREVGELREAGLRLSGPAPAPHHRRASTGKPPLLVEA